MCQLGKRCHFAHGLTQLQEFKSLRSQYKQQTDGFNQARLLPRNYKTQLCRFNDGGFCKFEGKCTFAHGQTQLKSQPKGGSFQQSQTQQLMQMQMMQQMGNNNMVNPQNMGMNPMMNPMNPMMKMNPMMNPVNQVNPQSMMQGQLYQNMMFQNMMQQQQQNYQLQFMKQQQQNQDQNVETIKKLEFIIPQLQKFHQNDSDFDTILQSADVLLKNKDLMNAAEKLNLIMHREDVSPEEEQFYQNLINEANEQIKQIPIPSQPIDNSQQSNFLQQQQMFQQMSQFNGMGQMGNTGSFNGMNMSQFEANQDAKKQKIVVNQQEQTQGLFEVIQKKPEILPNQQNNFSEDDISDDDENEILQSPFQNNQ